MAMLIMMANDGGKPFFHDFLGMRSTGSPAAVLADAVDKSPDAEPSSQLGSDRQAENNFEGVQFHSPNSDLSGPEIGNRLSGRKRSNSGSGFMGSTRDRMLQSEPHSPEMSRLKQMFGNTTGGEQPRRSREDGLFFAMQPPRPTSTQILQPPISGRSELVASKWGQSMPIRSGPLPFCPPRPGQFSSYVDNLCSNRYRDATATTSLTSQPAADEGSRTGINGPGVVNVFTVSGRNPTGVVPSSNESKARSQNTTPESANLPSRHTLTPASRQMTIFYGGQAHVFDDVHPVKAYKIMALAGTGGTSWTATYSGNTSMHPSSSETHIQSGKNEKDLGNFTLLQELSDRLPIQGNSNHGFSQGGQNSTLNLPAGIAEKNQGGMMVRDIKPEVQVAEEPNIEGKKQEFKIMTLVKSGGPSRNTMYPTNSNMRPSFSEARVHCGENEKGVSNFTHSKELSGRLSILVNSSHGFSQSGQISTPGSTLEKNEGGTAVGDSKHMDQATREPDIENKKEA